MINPQEIQIKTLGLKKYLIVIVFILAAPLTLLSSSLVLLNTYAQEERAAAEYQPNQRANILSALPASLPSISSEIVSEDARPALIREYLEYYNSPLVGHENFIVQTADRYGLDYRLITAIAQQESNLCKRIPPGSYNCWGWGIHSRGTLHFDSYEQGIDVVSAGLKENYIDKGYTNPDEIMKKYTPLSKGSWARGVNMFMMQMR